MSGDSVRFGLTKKKQKSTICYKPAQFGEMFLSELSLLNKYFFIHPFTIYFRTKNIHTCGQGMYWH